MDKDTKEQSRLLDDAQKNTGINRKYLLEKINPKSNLDTKPEMKIKEYVRIKRKRRRRYHDPVTPCQGILNSPEAPEKTKREIRRVYNSLNPAEIKRRIDKKLNLLHQDYKRKQEKRSGDVSKVDLKQNFGQKVSDLTKGVSVR